MGTIMDDASEYYKIRMEHTLQHLQQATRLIYFISGATIAMFYFVIDKMKDTPSQKAFGVGILLLLALVNAIHAMFIRVQADWYKRFERALAESTKAKKITRDDAWLSSRWLWASLHWLVAFGSLVFAIGLWGYT